MALIVAAAVGFVVMIMGLMLYWLASLQIDFTKFRGDTMTKFADVNAIIDGFEVETSRIADTLEELLKQKEKGDLTPDEEAAITTRLQSQLERLRAKPSIVRRGAMRGPSRGRRTTCWNQMPKSNDCSVRI